MQSSTSKEKVCILCLINKENKEDTNWTIIALDKPYKNLWSHKSCLNRITQEELQKLLEKTYKVWKNL